MIEVYRNILSLFDARERGRFWLLAAVMVVVAVAEVVGISTVLLLLKVLAAPAIITENATLAWCYQTFEFRSTFAFQVALSAAVFATVLGSLIIKALGTYAITRFSTMRGYTISCRLLESYLHKPYAWFLDHNSADVGKNVLSEVDGLVQRVIVPGLKLMSNMLVVIGIVGFLVYVDPVVSFLAAGFLGGSYAFIYVKMRDRLRHAGEQMYDAIGQRFVIATEATGGIKDVKLLGLEDDYVRRFAIFAKQSAHNGARMQLMSELPRFALEAITFGTLLGLVMVLLLRSGGDIAAIIPTLGIFAFAVMRLLPSLQQTYQGLASIRGARTALDSILRDYRLVEVPVPVTASADPLTLDRALELSGVGYRYRSADRTTLSGLDLTIAARTTVGLVGGTGAGKTTLVDLILGLLSPDEGEIRVDGTAVTASNLRSWQKMLGYVPQSIYLTDDTVAANIAFGVPADQIDHAAVERAARAAALHDFVVAELAKGYDTIVGERGIRLSGGQRQRIGIARALYRQPTLLIMDEATSALDTITERVVMEAVQNIRSDTTIILIAHRLSTVKTCDRIFLMEKGRVVAAGTYDELVKDSATFRKMATGG